MQIRGPAVRCRSYISGMTGPRSSRFDSAYPVPFRLERDLGPRRYLLTNEGQEPVDGITLTLLGAGVMPATVPSTLEPGESLEVMISRRSTGEEYLWRVSF